MDNKTVTYAVAFLVVQILVNCGIFVTFPQMTAYAVSKDNLESVETLIITMNTNIDKRLSIIEQKLNNLENRNNDKHYR